MLHDGKEPKVNRRSAARPAAPIFEGQLLHLLVLAALLAVVAFLAGTPAAASGELWGWTASTWLRVSVASAILHQGYVWLCWRLKLHRGTLTRTFPQSGFRLFKVGFGILGLPRWAIVPLAAANRGTLELPALL